ncbi:MAG: hypothetical protein FWG51_02680, partial [Firmicutes bacterium]|nr:hypothetical protein [Bacillota bacterium]
MKKTLISLLLIVSLFAFTACGNSIEGKYVITGVEIIGIEDLEELLDEMELGDGFSILLASIDQEALREILIDFGAYIEFKTSGKVDISVFESVEATFDFEI